ncbi:PD-(D/E)XK nuclease superfamily [uncultured Caudovirales phage]|uniref:PD-(D/E)XK nuclease superfamily n=1 Tax=uncultured Caudovirales phage TaxID=2100421 RepID=A0A6J5SJF7_9CAUD|nr:PD-(D/E)XK nuclease superfamily [uncultured Caudovirales phage]CAB4184195.1 PD-(D/E)XK nuclease superfamily [uncultured Caudovirales phage]CAB4214573.1 PD-(D/E)XK nuclease superfamily [uncultured Caudovirales phage]CAB5228776.1 PD-(D/E)XK nuclease superfamily [uncultured Caudovirales phage]
MKIDEENKRIYVRQSWLGDLAICPERARLGQVKPEFRTGSDATIIGTAIHAGIESVLDGRSSEFGDMLEVVGNEYETLETTNYKETNINKDMIPQYLESMSLAFYNEILPNVMLGGEVEKFFQVETPVNVGGYTIWLEGTMDYVEPDGTIWDWKTSSRAYYMKDKQKSAIQPTVYTYAEHSLRGGGEYGFKYGVMVRQETPKSQIVPIVRTAQHRGWLEHFLEGAVEMTLSAGMSKPWLMNDSSALCSGNWCSFWSICKGAYNLE